MFLCRNIWAKRNLLLQCSVSDVDQQKAEFARMVSKGDWNIDDAQRLLTDIHLLHRSEQQSNTRAQGNKRF